MGFLGSIRAITLKSVKNGVYDVEKLSDELVRSAKTAAPATDISNFFTTKFVRAVNNVPVLGESKLLDFSRFAREGNFQKSFGDAFPNNAALKNPAVRTTVNRMLLEARRTLPDFRYAQNAELLTSAKNAYKIDPKKLTSKAELASAVESNPGLKSAVSRVLSTAKTTGKVVIFGATVALAAYTADALYDKLVEMAAEESGCFAYWMDQNGLKKCKIESYSCRTGASGSKCLSGVLPNEILTNDDCGQDANKDKLCNHCSDDDPVNENLPQNFVLKCEDKTAGDMLLEVIGNTVGNVWSGVSSGLRSIFLYGTIFLVVVIVLVVMINFLR
jgi:hypothetical protein